MNSRADAEATKYLELVSGRIRRTVQRREIAKKWTDAALTTLARTSQKLQEKHGLGATREDLFDLVNRDSGPSRSEADDQTFSQRTTEPNSGNGEFEVERNEADVESFRNLAALPNSRNGASGPEGSLVLTAGLGGCRRAVGRLPCSEWVPAIPGSSETYIEDEESNPNSEYTDDVMSEVSSSSTFISSPTST